MGVQNESYVAVPGVVATHLMMVQADLGLRGLEAFLDRPPGPGDLVMLRRISNQWP